jgi:N6-L-threonylcarbamoyladenine synthase
MLGRPGADFSFSGLKTAVRHAAAGIGPLTPQDRADLAASFQAAVADVLADRAGNAMAAFRARHPAARHFVLAGGVAANAALRARLGTAAAAQGFALMVPPPRLCTDNGAMIAWAGIERLRLGLTDGLEVAARARWPLDPAAPPAAFAGVKA